MSLAWEEREKAEMDRFWAEYRSKMHVVPKPVPDERPWRLKAFIALGLMLYFWWQVAKWL